MLFWLGQQQSNEDCPNPKGGSIMSTTSSVEVYSRSYEVGNMTPSNPKPTKEGTAT